MLERISMVCFNPIDHPICFTPPFRDLFFKQGLYVETEQHAKHLSEQLEAARHAHHQTHTELAQTQSELAHTRSELEQVRAYAQESSSQLQASQEAQAELENIRLYTKKLYAENENLYRNLEAANTDIAFMQHSRGVRAIKLARTARHLLATRGPATATRQSLLWLSGKRGYWKRLAPPPAVPQPSPAAQGPAAEWTVRAQHLPDAAPFLGASIIIPIFNALEYAQACIESVYQAHVNIPFEVIAVDNGSQPDVLAWLQAESRQRERFFFLSLSNNLGFAKAMNLGMEQARGQYLVLHNSDTIATTGWLDHLARAAEHDPHTGIVSPVTNYVGEGWQIDEAARNLHAEEAEAYAAQIKGRASVLTVPDRLVFFSVMLKRAVLDTIGELHEGFGLGDYEDDEYCLRARVAGFKLAIAQNAFVYHHGSKTFVTNKINHAAWVDRNLACYLEKASQLSTERPPQGQRPKARERGEASVIVRTYNRPETLAVALTSLANQTLEAFEVVLVNDGGAGVEDIVRAFEAYFPITYIQHAEQQGPGAALNTGVQAAQGAWITYLNDDDVVYPGHLETLWATLHYKYPSAQVAYSEYNRALLASRTKEAAAITRVAAPRWEFSLPDMQVGHSLPIHAWMHARACYDDVGGFDASLAGLAEWDFQLRVAKRHPFYPTLRMTCEYRFYADAEQATVKHYHQQLEQLDALYQRHPVHDPALILQRQQRREHLKRQMAHVERTRQLGEYNIVPPEEARQKVVSLVAGF